MGGKISYSQTGKAIKFCKRPDHNQIPQRTGLMYNTVFFWFIYKIYKCLIHNKRYIRMLLYHAYYNSLFNQLTCRIVRIAQKNHPYFFVIKIFFPIGKAEFVCLFQYAINYLSVAAFQCLSKFTKSRLKYNPFRRF